MKKKKKSLWLLMSILTIFLLCTGTMLASASDSLDGVIIDYALFQDTSGAALEPAPSISTYSLRSTSGWSYGSQMASENETLMYETLAAIGDLTPYYYTSSSDRNGISVTLANPYVCEGTISTFQSSAGYIAGQQEWNRATHAYLRDYGMQYWISYFAVGVSKYTTTSDSVIIYALNFYPIDYYSDIRSELGLTEEALNEAISSVSSVSGRYNRVKAAHDYVAELVTYNSADSSASYGHTITGGLLEKYGHLGVCECYSKLFRLLCVENNIPCILVTGGSSKDEDGNVIANHMWNYVQMDDGNWYLVDVTWDDQSSIVFDYFLAGSSSQGFYDTVENDHMPVGCFSASVTYDSFVMPTLATEAYDVDSSVPVTGIVLDAAELTIHLGQSETLEVEGYLPAEATDGKSVRYASSDSSVATVNSSGKITAQKAGTAVITVTSAEYPAVTATCEVIVEGHSAGEWEITTEATCEEAGIQEKKCTVCGDVLETEVIAVVAHNYKEWVVDLENATQTRECLACGGIETENIEFEIIDDVYGAITTLTYESSDIDNVTWRWSGDAINSFGEYREVTYDNYCYWFEYQIGSKLSTTYVYLTSDDMKVLKIFKIVPVPSNDTVLVCAGQLVGITCVGAEDGTAITYEADDSLNIQYKGTNGEILTYHNQFEVVYSIEPTTTGSYEIVFYASDNIIAKRTINVVEHSYEGWLTYEDATCTADGFIDRQCNICGSYNTEIIPATGHSAGEWEITAEAACEEAGIQEKKCTICGDVVESEEIPATGHSAGEWEITTEATCEETGIQEKKCTVCGVVVESEDIPATGHSAGEWEVTTEAACEETGIQEKKCIWCGEVLESEEIPVNGHIYGAWETVEAATCTTAETLERTCACGVKETKTGKSATGHTPGTWTITKEATGSSEGTKVQTCTVCGEVLATQSIAKTAVTLNVTGTVPLQKKKSTTAIKIASQTSGDSVDKWTSSNEKIVKVNAKTGKITAQKKTGTATVTVTMKSGAKASVKIKVQSGKVKTKKLTVSKTQMTLKVKETYTITTVRTPVTTSDKVTFSSSNKKVVAVNSKGKITAKKAGKATITVKSGSKKVKVKVTVTK